MLDSGRSKQMVMDRPQKPMQVGQCEQPRGETTG